MICEICKKEYASLGMHLKFHGVSPKDYYDNFQRIFE